MAFGRDEHKEQETSAARAAGDTGRAGDADAGAVAGAAGGDAAAFTNDDAPKGRKALVKALIFACIVALLLVCNAVFGWSAMFDASGVILALRAVMAQNLLLALVVYVLGVAVLGTVLALPGALFAVVAGVCFGPVLGTVACTVAATLGAVLSFLVGRYFLQDAIRPRAMRNKLLRKWLFESDANAVVVLAVTRLVPVFPFNLQNFAYGISNVSLATYTWCTALFILPGTALYVVATAGLVDATQRIACFAVAALLLVVSLLLAYVVRKHWMDANDAASSVADCAAGSIADGDDADVCAVVSEADALCFDAATNDDDQKGA